MTTAGNGRTRRQANRKSPGFWPIALAGLFAASLCLPVHATLVAVVPSRDGLVVAADSRLTFMGVQCDGAFKILLPAHPARTVAVVTGDSVFVPPPPPGVDPCRYISSANRLLDINALVSRALGRTGGDPARISIAGLSASCLNAVQKFGKRYPAAIRPYAGKDLFSVVVASFEPRSSVTVVRRFVVRVGAGPAQVQVADQSQRTFFRTHLSDVLVFGETSWVQSQVYAGPGRRFLHPATLQLLHDRTPIGDLSTAQAAVVARNVIEAACLQAAETPPPTGIGGAIRVIAIGSGPRPKMIDPPVQSL